jgi:hypothetical protein
MEKSQQITEANRERIHQEIALEVGELSSTSCARNF